MTNSKKILITTATSEIFIVRQVDRSTICRFCKNCEAETEMLDLNLAVTIFRLSLREIVRQIEAGVFHSTETESGHLLVCQNSIQKFRK